MQYVLIFCYLGSPVVPRNVQVERGIANGEVIVVWEPIENAAGYVVQVKPIFLTCNLFYILSTLL